MTDREIMVRLVASALRGGQDGFRAYLFSSAALRRINTLFPADSPESPDIPDGESAGDSESSASAVDWKAMAGRLRASLGDAHGYTNGVEHDDALWFRIHADLAAYDAAIAAERGQS